MVYGQYQIDALTAVSEKIRRILPIINSCSRSTMLSLLPW
jgi:hypothetical protein